ncbi:MAG: adenylate/guanylate cyclase domain-containing protein [Candidatus Woesearchaeota archaeon]
MIHKIIKNKIFVSVIVSVFISMMLTSLFLLGVFNEWNIKLSDNLYTQRKPLEEIIIISIDDKSLQEIGRWPWPREIYIETLPKFKNSKVVGLDIAFFESYKRDVDTKLGEVLSELNAVIPIEFTDYKIKDGNIYVSDILKPVGEIGNGSDAAFVNIITDNDGIVRESYLLLTSIKENITYQSFPLKIAQKYLNKNITFEFNKFIINFIGKPNSFRTIPFSDVYYNRTNESFKNKIVLIGATATDLHDNAIVPTSEGKLMAGVEIHANAIQTILTKKFLKRQSNLGVVATIIVLSLITGLLLALFRFSYASFLSIALFITYISTAILTFNKGIILNLVYPFLAITFTFFSITIFFYFHEGKERRRIKSLFGKYVSKEVVEEILKKTDKDRIDLKGETKEITILFSDIRGFTSMSEKMKPHDVVAMLNKYLGGLTDIIFKNKGTLDKYIGDCIMAIFGAPIDDKEHAFHAVKAGVEMRDKIIEMQKRKKQKVGMGIGINTGIAVVGNMGSKERVDYTAIGDSVNLASRLCSNAKSGQVIISEETYKLVKDRIIAKDLGEIQVKGKAKPVKIYNVIALK